jgi:hypothetical protein
MRGSSRKRGEGAPVEKPIEGEVVGILDDDVSILQG